MAHNQQVIPLAAVTPPGPATDRAWLAHIHRRLTHLQRQLGVAATNETLRQLGEELDQLGRDLTGYLGRCTPQPAPRGRTRGARHAGFGEPGVPQPGGGWISGSCT